MRQSTFSIKNFVNIGVNILIIKLAIILFFLLLINCKQCSASLEGSMLYIIKYCPNLRHLILSNCPNISENSVGQAIQNIPTLRSLILTGNKHITDRLFNWISKHGYNIERLGLWPNVADEKIKKLKACLNLRELQVNNNKNITDKTFAKLLKKLNLLVLNVDGCTSALGDLSLQALATFHQNLQALSGLECGAFKPESIEAMLNNCLSLQVRETNLSIRSDLHFNIFRPFNWTPNILSTLF